jgi:hypothetical protein
MSTYQKATSDLFLQKFGKDVFQSNKTAAYPAGAAQIAGILGLALLAVLIAGFVTLQPAASFTPARAADMGMTQGMEATKSDRTQTTLPASCEGQAWGAWSPDCAAALTGSSSVRNVGYVTVEQPSKTINETILARFPTMN